MVLSTLKRIGNLKLYEKDPRRLPAKLRPYLLESLARLMNQGFSLNQSLSFMKVLLPNQQSAIEHINQQLSKGETFERSLQALGYSLITVAQLFYSQRQGRFISGMKEVAQDLTQMRDYQQKVVKQITYPLLMSVFLVVMLFAMRQFMLPQITSFISKEAYDESFSIRLLVGFFTYLPQIFLSFIACVLIGYLMFDFYFLKQTYVKRYQLLNRLPYFHRWVKSMTSYKISHELGYFFSSGFSIQQFVQLLVDYPIDPFLTEIGEHLQKSLLQGIPLPEILNDLEIFTQELPLVIYQGELTSQLGEQSSLYAEKILNDLLEDVSRKLNYLQPILLLVIATLVMVMYLLMMLPMLTMEGI